MEAKIAQIDLLDEFRFKYGYQYKIYTEFIDSKKDLRTVYEDIIPPSTTSQLFDNTPSGPEIKYWVYVLLCEESKYYVGFTSNLRKRFKNHNSSRGGSNYTFEYTPICVLHIEGHKNAKSAKNAERDWTLDLKKLNGRDNVYGYWSKSYDSESSVYYAHELLENWTVKNIKAFDL
jgi:putative endonuclease